MAFILAFCLGLVCGITVMAILALAGSQPGQVS